MDNNLYKKPETPDFSDPAVQRSFIEETHTGADLMRKELEVNREEHVLLDHRIQLMRSFANDLPSTDPQYSMLLTQIQMDQLELDELKLRFHQLREKLSELQK